MGSPDQDATADRSQPMVTHTFKGSILAETLDEAAAQAHHAAMAYFGEAPFELSIVTHAPPAGMHDAKYSGEFQATARLPLPTPVDAEG